VVDGTQPRYRIELGAVGLVPVVDVVDLQGGGGAASRHFALVAPGLQGAALMRRSPSAPGGPR
jgi:hypothetical protein